MSFKLINAILTVVVSFLLTIVIMPVFIPILKRFKFGQNIYVDAPKSHQSKQGTPTMGGIVFVLSSLITMLLINPQAFFSLEGLSIMIVYVGCFLIGLLDDILIIVRKKNDGLRAKLKLGLQIFISILFVLVAGSVLDNDNFTNVSFIFFDVQMGMFFPLFVIFMIVAYSNAVNLTDGLDGLSCMTVAISLSFLGFIAYHQQQFIELMFILAVVASLLGFFVFNHKPAKIFMGDTGSLALGGFYAVMAIILKVEIISIIIGMVFVLETLSVVIQVISFKKRGKRVFKMAPLHHHFEMGKLKEKGTVLLFYGLSIIFGLLGMVIYCVTL